MNKPKQKRTLLATLIAVALAILGWWWFQSATTQKTAQDQPSQIETSTQRVAKSSKVPARPQPGHKLSLASGKTSFDELQTAATQGDTQAMLALRNTSILCHDATDANVLKNHQSIFDGVVFLKQQQFALYTNRLDALQRFCLDIGYRKEPNQAKHRLQNQQIMEQAAEMGDLTAAVWQLRRLDSVNAPVTGEDVDLLMAQIQSEQNPDALFELAPLMQNHRTGSARIPDALNGTDKLTTVAWQYAACRLGAEACQTNSFHTHLLCFTNLECRYNDYATYIDQSIAPADRQRFEWMVDEVIQLYRNRP